ncbi:MAG: ABC transporter ATP-binding protein [Pseudomonadota bacterium]|nr:MAG: ABC transporter ATP-binding protein [Pseudomonadota bacterium]
MRRTVIEVVGLHKSFGPNHVLRGLDLTVEKGAIQVIIGASGSGKSVLLKHIIGLLSPDAGRIYVDGEEITRMSPREIMRVRKKFGMVFQTSALFDSLTVAENVAFPLRVGDRQYGEEEIRRIVREKLALVHLEGVEHLMPAELSGGMKKRVALARAVAHDPEIVLYDEPTTGLDPITVESVNDLILETRDRLQVTSVVISHDMASALYIADDIAVLKEGRIIFRGTPEEIQRADHPYVRRFLHPRAARP